jgi:hypothetical protein
VRRVGALVLGELLATLKHLQQQQHLRMGIRGLEILQMDCITWILTNFSGLLLSKRPKQTVAALNIELQCNMCWLIFTIFEVLEGPIHEDNQLETSNCN